MVRAGILAEIVASVGIALTLLLVFRDQDFAILGDTLGAEALSGGSAFAAMLAALAVGGWVFIGFDCAVGVAEETEDAGSPRPPGDLDRAAQRRRAGDRQRDRRHPRPPRPGRIVAGADLDPVTTAVTTSFGSWSDKPFAAVVLCAFVACAVAAQGVTARMAYSMARDGSVPGSRWLSRVDRRANPIGGIVATASFGCAGLLLGLEATAVQLTVPAADTRLHTVEEPGGEPALLFLSGGFGNVGNWDRVIDRLGGRYRTVRFDARGRGKSGASADYSVQAAVGDVERVIEATDLERPILVGVVLRRHAGGAARR